MTTKKKTKKKLTTKELAQILQDNRDSLVVFRLPISQRHIASLDSVKGVCINGGCVQLNLETFEEIEQAGQRMENTHASEETSMG
jgi:hypothetical protein